MADPGRDAVSVSAKGVKNVTSCLRQNGHLYFSVDKHLTVHANSWGGAQNQGLAASLVCAVTARTTQGNRLVAEVWKPIEVCKTYNHITVSDGHKSYKWSRYMCFALKGYEAVPFTSTGNSLKLELHVVQPLRSYNLWVNLSSVEPKIDVIHLSPTQGYLQTPGNDRWKPYFSLMNTWQTLQLPSDHVTLLSMSRFHVEGEGDCDDVVEVFKGGKWEGNKVWRVCGHTPPVPVLLDSPEVHVHFKTNDRVEFEGFKLTYSFHRKPHQLSHAADSRWNCSVPEWPDLQRHFRCNLRQECIGAEDEAQCLYTGHCGQGYLTLDNWCYKYVAATERLSWEEASIACAAHGGRLASLNTPQEWDRVVELLKAAPYHRQIFVGLRASDPTLPSMNNESAPHVKAKLYQRSWQWADGSIAVYKSLVGKRKRTCGRITPYLPDHVDVYRGCSAIQDSDFLCEFDSSTSRNSGQQHTVSGIRFVPPSKVLLVVPHVVCPTGHLTHDFLACDERSACWSSYHGNGNRGKCGIPSRASHAGHPSLFHVMFTCADGLQQVPYTFVCDHRQHCLDGSDEKPCVFPPCSGSTPLQCAFSAQCVGPQAYCDSTPQCVDRSDEASCVKINFLIRCDEKRPVSVLRYDSSFRSCRLFRKDPVTQPEVTGNTAPSLCPNTHFQCPGNGYCLPVYMRCNGVVDCPGREDEDGCTVLGCPGFYRCRGSQVCLHVSHVCDGVHQCPEQDDELYCHPAPCPHNCTCQGQAFVCSGSFAAWRHTELRYLDASGSGLSVSLLSKNVMLVHLSLAQCGVQSLHGFGFPNLRTLNLSDNFITAVSVNQLRSAQLVQLLILSGNPLSALFSAEATLTLDHLESVDVSRIDFGEVDLNSFASFPKLSILSLSHSTVQTLYRTDNRSLQNLRVLDLRKSHVTRFRFDVVSDLGSLEAVTAESYKFCCPAVLPPKFNTKNCQAPVDLVSSCDNLLSSSASRTLLSLCCCFALLGNVVSLVVRSRCLLAAEGVTATDVFVTHLSVGDVMMGVCVAVVLGADRLLSGSYARHDTAWRHSALCAGVGFLFLLATQVSVCMVLLVSLDSLLSRGFFGARRATFKPGSAQIASAFVWTGCLLLAALPVLPSSARWKLFGRTAACFPLFTVVESTGQTAPATYSVAVIVANLLMTSITAAGLITLRISFRKTSSSSVVHGLVAAVSAGTKPGEVSHARRVFSSCLLSVVCWLPVTVLAVLAWRGTLVLEVLHAHAGLLALPVTSALRPVMYGVGVRAEASRRERAERLMAYLVVQSRHKAGDKHSRPAARREN